MRKLILLLAFVSVMVWPAVARAQSGNARTAVAQTQRRSLVYHRPPAAHDDGAIPLQCGPQPVIAGMAWQEVRDRVHAVVYAYEAGLVRVGDMRDAQPDVGAFEH